MTHIPFIQRIGERSVYRCDFCGTEESYADATDVAAFARFRTEFVQKHSQCKTPTVKPTNPPGQKEEIPMVKERKKAGCSHCGETGHNAKTCEKKGLDRLEHGAPTRATLRKNRGGRRTADPKPAAAAPRTPAVAPASPVNGITIHTEHSIVSVTTESGATVIRVREVGHES